MTHSTPARPRQDPRARLAPPARRRPWALLLAGLLACEGSQGERPDVGGPAGPDPARPAPPPGPDDDAPATDREVPPVPATEAPPPSPRVSTPSGLADVASRLESWFGRAAGARVYLQLDKPLYKPGETIWFRAFHLGAKDLAARGSAVRIELVSPKGSVVLQKLLAPNAGLLTNDFVIPEEAQGGEYKLRLTSLDGATTAERPLILSTYEPPRLKKKLELTRKAYGPGDPVAATISVKRATGEPLADHPVRGVVMLDGEALAPIAARTNPDGGAVLKFQLPAKIERGDGLLTVLVEDAGVTESVSKSIPILLKRIQLSFFPEGGQLVSGLPSRVYFEAKSPIGKPADVEGRIVDDQGNAVATFRTHHFGLGRMSLTPSVGRTYHAEITRPAGIAEHYPVPLALESGCAMSTYDDFDGARPELRVAVRCTEAQVVTVVGAIRERVFDVASVSVTPGAAAVVHLLAKDDAVRRAQGVARVTLLDEERAPLAERLVYRNRRAGLHLTVEPDRPSYSPRDKVGLVVSAKDPAGRPVPGVELAVSVVDDTVIALADDKTGHLLSRLFLEPELPGPVEEPNFFFDLREKKSAEAMDHLMGARGYRRFEWHPVWNPPPAPPAMTGGGRFDDGAEMAIAEVAKEDRPVRRPKAAGPALPPPPVAAPVPAAPPPPPPPAAEPMPMPAAEAKGPAKKDWAGGKLVADERPVVAREKRKAEAPMEEEAWAGAPARQQAVSYAPVRVFPAPTYSGPVTGPRTDFRETIHWAPALVTGADGKVRVEFYLSDAVTSFRVFGEGVGAGLGGRVEHTFKSSLPFSLGIKLPVEVSAGDKLLLPLTLSNERTAELPIALESSFGALVRAESALSLPSGRRAAGARESLYFPLTVIGKSGKSKVRIAADAGGLKDEFERELTVVPVGFPVSWAESGSLEKTHVAKLDLSSALEGTATLDIKVETSPVGTMMGGLDGMLREPYGCFEQTSSTNYPNVMIMQYLRSNDVADPELVEKVSGLIDRGYKRLVGFEADRKGYEWFGRAPAHEALTAYGVLEFIDMRSIYGEVDEDMLKRTTAWLLARRDNKGGFLRDSQALDTFGQASPEITNAYIVYALAEAGLSSEIRAELDAQLRLGAATDDPYLLALITNALQAAKRSEAAGLAARLQKLQGKDGAWRGKTHSVTRSTGVSLDVETTSLAILAMLDANQDAAAAAGVRWLYGQRSAYGAFGATQSTVLALKALTEFTTKNRRAPSDGRIVVRVNGRQVAEGTYLAGRQEPLVFTGLGSALSLGSNEVELVHEGSGKLPFTLGVEYRALKPATHPEAVVELETRIARTTLKMGENVRVTALVKNKTGEGQPMTLARIGVPGGLQFQTWQLKELREKGLIAFYETRAREVILYFRDLKPSEVKEIPLDLVAEVPGEYTGPASSAYLYYTNEKKVWVDGLRVQIER